MELLLLNLSSFQTITILILHSKKNSIRRKAARTRCKLKLLLEHQQILTFISYPVVTLARIFAVKVNLNLVKGRQATGENYL